MRKFLVITIGFFVLVPVYMRAQDAAMIHRCNSIIKDIRKDTTLADPNKYLQLMQPLHQQYGDFVSYRPENVNMCASWNSCYAHLNYVVGNYAEAGKTYRNIIDQFPPHHKHAQAARQNLLHIWLRQGLYNEVIDMVENHSDILPSCEKDRVEAQFLRAEAYYNRNLTGDMQTAYAIVADLANTYEKQQDIYLKAMNNLGLMLSGLSGSSLKDALRILENGRSAFGELELASLNDNDRMNYYTLLSNLAYAEGRVHLFDDALMHIHEVLAWQQKHGNAHHYITSLWKRAQILYEQAKAEGGAKTDMVSAFKMYFEQERDYILRHFTTMTEHERSSFWAAQYELITSCYLVGEADPDFVYEVALFVKNLMLLSTHTDDPKFTKNIVMTPNDVRSRLKANEVAIEWIETSVKDTQMYVALIVARKSKVKFLPVIPKSKLLDRMVCGEMYEDKNIGEDVWKVILNDLPDSANIYFSPTGIMQLMAIEYFGVDRHGCNFYRLTSTGELCNNPVQWSRNNKTLLVGGVNYNAYDCTEKSRPTPDRTGYETLSRAYCFGRDRVFSYLPGAEREVDSIMRIVQDKQQVWLLKGDKATERRIKDTLPSFEIVHLSTHGYSMDFGTYHFLQRDSLMQDQLMTRTGLALAGANVVGLYRSDLEDGILTAKEISEMDLRGVHLVVLSACQTAVAKMTDEEVASIARAFKKAGVQSLIVSLWSTGDDASQVFFTQLYRFLEADKNHSVHRAFAQAREYMISAGEVEIPYTVKTLSSKTLSGHTERTLTRKVDLSQPLYYNSYIILDAIY